MGLGLGTRCLIARDGSRGGGQLRNAEFPSATFSRTGVNSRKIDYLTLRKPFTNLGHVFNILLCIGIKYRAFSANVFEDH